MASPPAFTISSISAPVGRLRIAAERIAEHLARQRRQHLAVLLLQIVSRPSAPTIVVLSRELAGRRRPACRRCRSARVRPTASKPSSGKPSGSMRRWQVAHCGVALVRVRRSRSVRPPKVLSSAGSVPASAGGGGVGVDEDAAQDPVAALDRAGAQRRRRRGQHRAEAQRAAAIEASRAVDLLHRPRRLDASFSSMP